MDTIENKYKAGDVVYEKNKPDLRMVVRRFLDQIYYCTVPGEPDRKDLVFFERELIPEAEKKQ